jgi:hypothetical protein
MQDYTNRLRVPVTGCPSVDLRTSSGTLVATGFVRVVLGSRGPYVEFDDLQLVLSNLAVPESQKHRLGSSAFYYDEWRTVDDASVKFYHQKSVVDYADYRPGMWYASPFDLYLDDGKPLIEPLRKPEPPPSLFD